MTTGWCGQEDCPVPYDAREWVADAFDAFSAHPDCYMQWSRAHVRSFREADQAPKIRQRLDQWTIMLLMVALFSALFDQPGYVIASILCCTAIGHEVMTRMFDQQNRRTL